jgi:hypothetical protein
VSHLVDNGVTHLQYADDTILLIELDDSAIANLKFILICFEILSGLTINFSKSEVIVTGVSHLEQARVARMFNCKEGKFPLSYLGFPIADRKLTIADMNYLVEIVGHRVDPWQGRHSSIAARHILTKASLASLPSHCMGLFLLAEGTHAAFDKVLARFFWEGVGEKRKYHWFRWEDCCVPQILGGLGLTNTRAMNLTLMLKWVWRILQPASHNSLWFKLLAAKYPHSISLFSSGARVALSSGKAFLRLSTFLD